jgi:hypothetical protein
VAQPSEKQRSRKLESFAQFLDVVLVEGAFLTYKVSFDLVEEKVE